MGPEIIYEILCVYVCERERTQHTQRTLPYPHSTSLLLDCSSMAICLPSPKDCRLCEGRVQFCPIALGLPPWSSVVTDTHVVLSKYWF